MVSELETFANQTIEPCVMLYNKTIELLPGIIVALVMLFLGLLLSRWTSTLTKAILTRVKLDQWTERFGVNELLSRIGFEICRISCILVMLSL